MKSVTNCTVDKVRKLVASRRWHVRRLHHAIKPEYSIGVIRMPHQSTENRSAGASLVRLHFRQSDFDGACGIHVAAMALAILGIASPRQLEKMTTARSGIAKKLWGLSRDYFFSGMAVRQLCEIFSALDVGIRFCIKRAGNKGITEFTKRHLAVGSIVIIAYSYKNGDSHFVLAVGSEGYQSGEGRNSFQTDALLVIDPGAETVPYCGFNGRLVLRPEKHSGIEYESCTMKAEVVRLTAAVALYVSDALSNEAQS